MRRHTLSRYPNEETYGYARAVRAGDMIFVSGTTARAADLDRDAYGQAMAALRIVEAALAELDAGLDDVVRTVAYVTTLDDEPLVARAHAQAFGAVRPASTLVEVSRLTPEAARVEFEITAVARS